VLETNDWIEEPLYGKIRRLMPMAAVDILAVHDGRVLLMLRNNEPAKDCWFTPGGRIRYGETPEQAAFRELREETGLIADKLELKGVMSHFYEHIHYVTVFYKASVSSDSVVLNPEHRDYKWISHLSIDLHPYARQMIMYSRIFNDS
jgi:colanic acid biosynthesis protein WcaH